jgi:hypothetical protein
MLDDGCPSRCQLLDRFIDDIHVLAATDLSPPPVEAVRRERRLRAKVAAVGDVEMTGLAEGQRLFLH